MIKKTTVATDANGRATVNPEKMVLIGWNGGDQRELSELLNELLAKAGITRSEVSNILGEPQGAKPRKVPLSYVSRWLAPQDPERSQLPIWVLARLAASMNRIPLLALVERQAVEVGAAISESARLRREFFFGMTFVNPREGPTAVARHIASVWGAKSWSLYREDPRKNTLEWFEGGGLQERELMYGPSWAWDLPTRIVRFSEAQSQNPLDDATTVEPYRVFDWADKSQQERSVFASREGVSFCIPLTVRGKDLLTMVLFLNFGQRPPEAFYQRDSLDMAINELRGAAELSWRANWIGGRMDRGRSNQEDVLTLVRQGFAGNKEHVKNLLEQIGGQVWPTQEKTCQAYLLRQPVRALKEPPSLLSFYGKADPDTMVERSVSNGETFYIESLSEKRVRGRLDPRNRVAAWQEQKLVVPLLCEAFLDTPIQFTDAIGESPGHLVMQNQAPSKQFLDSWGALTVESRERIFSPAQRMELNVLGHLVACSLYMQRKISEAHGDMKAFFENLRDGVDQIIMGIGQVSSTHGPLDGLCEVVVKKGMLGPAQRCDIYRYDRVTQAFVEGGSHIAQKWLESTPVGHLPNIREYLRPRKGGNSERLLGVADEYHVISDATSHPRVSPITKIMGTESLVGCSCKVGVSFRSEAVLWLGYQQRVPPTFLKENVDMCNCLRVVAHVAALFCVLLRWWPVLPAR